MSRKGQMCAISCRIERIFLQLKWRRLLHMDTKPENLNFLQHFSKWSKTQSECNQFGFILRLFFCPTVSELTILGLWVLPCTCISHDGPSCRSIHLPNDNFYTKGPLCQSQVCVSICHLNYKKIWPLIHKYGHFISSLLLKDSISNGW